MYDVLKLAGPGEKRYNTYFSAAILAAIFILSEVGIYYWRKIHYSLIMTISFKFGNNWYQNVSYIAATLISQILTAILDAILNSDVGPQKSQLQQAVS